MENTVNLFAGEDATLIKLDLKTAEEDGTLLDVASTWNFEDGRSDPRHYESWPARHQFREHSAIRNLPAGTRNQAYSQCFNEALEAPVEIEFAVDVDNEGSSSPVFYLLQLKHMLRDSEEFSINKSEIKRDQLMLYADNGMGNGRIEEIADVVWIDPDVFDKSCTEEMALEVQALNIKLREAAAATFCSARAAGAHVTVGSAFRSPGRRLLMRRLLSSIHSRASGLTPRWGRISSIMSRR